MNFFTAAHKEDRELLKMKKQWESIHGDSPDEDVCNKFEELLDAKFDRVYRRAVRRMLMAREINEELGLTSSTVKQTYMITIRPECKKISFDKFYKEISTLVKRKCFLDYQLSFEQKGMTLDTLGHGFHVHIVAHMTQKSKGQVLRDIKSSMGCGKPNAWIIDNCIQVDVCKNPEETVQNYLIDYKSKDNHKETTKEWDDIWRSNVGIKNIYVNDLTESVPAIKSVAGTSNSVTIIELN